MATSHDQYLKATAQLEVLSGKYPEASTESESIRHAAQALAYIFSEGQWDKFTKYLETFNSPLSPEQREHLISMGIDPDTPSKE